MLNKQRFCSSHFPIWLLISITQGIHESCITRHRESCSFWRLRKTCAMHTPFLRYSPPWTSQESRRLSPSRYGPTVEVFSFPFSSTILITCGGTENQQKCRYSYRREYSWACERLFWSRDSDAMRGRGCPGLAMRWSCTGRARHTKSPITRNWYWKIVPEISWRH